MESKSADIFKTEQSGLREYPSWVSTKDVAIMEFGAHKKSIIIEPEMSASVYLSIDESFLPSAAIDKKILSELRFSTRSCIAQAGSFVYFSKDSELSDNNIGDLGNGKSIKVKAELRNYGNNPIKFAAKDRLGRFFHTNEKDLIEGNDLLEVIKNGLVKGEKGKDYVVFERTYTTPYAIALKVTPGRICIPKGEAGPYIRVTSRDDIYRLGKRLTDEPEDVAKCPFYLQETRASVDVPPGIVMILSGVTSKKDVIHLPSHLIDAGSKWPIRLEIEGGEVDWVLARLYRSPISDINRSADELGFMNGLKSGNK